jgi:hypothetical protein
MGIKSGSSRKLLSPNPYFMAFLTAFLSAAFSVTGSYFTVNLQARHAIAQKRLEFRVQAYGTFLEKIDRNKSPAISQLLSIGAMAESVTTDGEIQALENRLSALFSDNDEQEFFWQLNSDLNVLRVHGSNRVEQISKNMLDALSFRSENIDWSAYPAEISNFHKDWKRLQEQGVAYGWTAKVSEDQRLMIVILAKLTQVLLSQLRIEVQAAT